MREAVGQSPEMETLCETIHTRVEAIGSWLLDALVSLMHSNGARAATIYGPGDFNRRGATIAFNFLHPDGRIVDERGPGHA